MTVKVHLITAVVFDINRDELEVFRDVFDAKICGNILNVKTHDTGEEWDDDNPLNHRDTQKEEIKRLFGDTYEW
jgi:hypothetical protein